MQLRVPDTMTAGSTVKCPKCSAAFQLPMAGSDPATGAAPSPAAPPSDFSARPTAPVPNWGAGPERADAPRDPYQRSMTSGLEGLSNNYQIEFGEYFNLGMKHYTAVLGPMIGYMFVLLACFLPRIIPCLGPCLNLILSLTVDFALYAGFWLVCLKQFRGENWSFGDFFGAFQFWVPLFLNNLLYLLLSMVCLAPGYAFIIFAQVQAAMEAQQNRPVFVPGNPPPPLTQPQPDPTLVIIGLVLILLGLMPLIYVYIRCFLFNTLLIVDRNCNAIDAIKGTWLLTSGHFFGWFGMMFVLGLLGFVCALFTCGIGYLFAVPLLFLVITAAWMSITDPDVIKGSTQ